MLCYRRNRAFSAVPAERVREVCEAIIMENSVRNMGTQKCAVCGSEMEYVASKDAFRCAACGRLIMRVEAEIEDKKRGEDVKAFM